MEHDERNVITPNKMEHDKHDKRKFTTPNKMEK